VRSGANESLNLDVEHGLTYERRSDVDLREERGGRGEASRRGCEKERVRRDRRMKSSWGSVKGKKKGGPWVSSALRKHCRISVGLGRTNRRRKKAG